MAPWLCLCANNQKRFTSDPLDGCRTGEICNMAWKDVDLEKGTIHLRETKTGVERYVQLSDQAIDFLKVLRLTSDKYLFPSQATKKPIQQKYLTENLWRLRENGQMLDIPHWTPQGLRRTVRTGLSRLQCPNEVAETVLGIHVAALKVFIICISMMLSAGSGCRYGQITWIVCSGNKTDL